MRRPNGPDDHGVSGEVTAWRDCLEDCVDWCVNDRLSEHIDDALHVAYVCLDGHTTFHVAAAFVVPADHVTRVSPPREVPPQTPDPTWCPGLRGVA